ncbi:MAG: hypothetical protein GX556_09075 [Fibrobacter sp.]|nr:hypothetical protein [Fibrobacter sp.]
MSNNKMFLTFLLLIFSAAIIYSQSVLGLQYPFGLPLQNSNGPSLAIGGAGTGVADDYYGMGDNPANLGNVNRAVFSAVFALDLLNILDNGDRTSHMGFSPRVLSFSFPLGIIGSLGFSYSQQTDTELNFRLSRDYRIGNLEETEDLALVRNGGTANWQAGWGIPIRKWATVGIAYQRLYYKSNSSLIRKTEGLLSDTLIDSTRTAFTSNGIRAGVQTSLKDFTLGISGQYVFSGTATDIRTIKGTRVKADSPFKDSIITRKSSYDLKPAPSMALGASYRISPEWFAAMEIGATLWERFYSEISKKSDKYDRAYNFSIGTEYIPAPNLLTPKYYEIMQYRAGFRYSQLPTPDAAEFAFTLGTGLPLRDGGGLFDIVLEYGRRWDSNFKNFTEEFAGIYLGINAGRKWYQSAQDSY